MKARAAAYGLPTADRPGSAEEASDRGADAARGRSSGRFRMADPASTTPPKGRRSTR